MDVDTVVIGAGLSGVCAAIDLKRSGRESFLVLEKGSSVGGTWRDNTYPGVECDVPSHLYSYSFAPSADWSKRYARGGEIHRYIQECAARFGVDEHIRFDTRVEEARWSGDSWELRIEGGELLRAHFLVGAVGGLHTPRIPELPGLDSFRGPVFHTSRWRPDVALGGRVGMIGTGATAVQAAPEVAQIAARFHLFQRSPAWVGQKWDPPYTPDVRERFTADPQTLRAHRWELWRKWESIGLEMVTAGTPTNVAAERAAREHIAGTVRDPELVAKLTPTHNITCKRPTFSNRYYPMFNRENVQLVTAPIERVTPSGIVCDGEEIPLDVLILATGFQPLSITSEVALIGQHGAPLGDVWRARAETYRSTMVEGFPNFFLMLGPNSFGLNSAVQMIEAQSRFIVRAIDFVEKSGMGGIVPKAEEVRRFTEMICRLSAKTTMNKGCSSWWSDENGHNHIIWPESSITYRMLLQDLCPDHFDLLRHGDRPTATPAAAVSVSR